MPMPSDNKPGLSASRVCKLTGVRPQTRDTWVRRGLLRTAERYGELDVIEQAVLKALLSLLPKSDVPLVWRELRPTLRLSTGHSDLLAAWDTQRRDVVITSTSNELSAAVRHGRPVFVIPLGDIVLEARRVYRAEVEGNRTAPIARRHKRVRATGS